MNKDKQNTYFHQLLKIAAASLQTCHFLLAPELVNYSSAQKRGKVYRQLYMAPKLDSWVLEINQTAIKR